MSDPAAAAAARDAGRAADAAARDTHRAADAAAGDTHRAAEPAAPRSELLAAPLKPPVGAEGFAALDLRVARVEEVLPFPEARKPAWRMRLDAGPVVGRVQTSAQVTGYSAEELVGRSVVVAVNLGSRRIAGWRSDVLVLGALHSDGVRLLAVDGDDVAPGTPIA